MHDIVTKETWSSDPDNAPLPSDFNRIESNTRKVEENRQEETTARGNADTTLQNNIDSINAALAGYSVGTSGDAIRVHHGYIKTPGNTTQDVLFDAFSSAIPNVNDVLALSGYRVVGGQTQWVAMVIRSSSTTMTLYAANPANEYTVTLTNGSAGGIGGPVAIAW